MLLLPSASQSVPRGSHASKLNSRWQRQGTWVLKTPFSRGQRPKAPQEHRNPFDQSVSRFSLLLFVLLLQPWRSPASSRT